MVGARGDAERVGHPLGGEAAEHQLAVELHVGDQTADAVHDGERGVAGGGRGGRRGQHGEGEGQQTGW